MDGGESEGDSDGIATMKDFREPLQTYTSPYPQISKRSWSQSNILDETSYSYDPSSASPLKADEYDDVSEDSNNDTGTGFVSVSPMVSGKTDMMNTTHPAWLSALTRPNTVMDSDVEEACMKVDGEKPLESPQYDHPEKDEHPLAELFTEDTVPMQAQDSEDELQRSLQESVNRHKVLAMKTPWSPPPHALQHGPQPQPLPPEWVEEEQYVQPVLYGEEYYDDEELKMSLMESVKRHSMLSRRRSLGLEEPREPNDVSWETGSSDSYESQEEELVESKVSEETTTDTVIESRTELMDAEMEPALEVKEECEENVADEKTGYSDNIVDSGHVFSLAVSCSGGGDGEGGCRKRRTLMREVRCLVNDDAINSLMNPSSTASPDRISRRLRPRSCARALKENPKEIEYLMNFLRDGGEEQCKPSKRMQGKGCKSGLVGIPMVAINNHQKEEVESCISSSSGNTRARNSCRGKKGSKGSGIVVRAMLKRREKCKVARPSTLSDQKKKAIRVKLALEKKKLLMERRAALERELEAVVVDNVDQVLLAKATRRLDLEDRVQVPVNSEDVRATMPCVKLEESQIPPQSPSCNTSHVFLISPCGSSYACGSVTLGPGSLQPSPMTLAQGVAEIYPLQFAVPVGTVGLLGNQQGTVTQLKPETLKELAAKVSQGLKVAAVPTKEQERARVVEARTVEPQLRPECGDERLEVNGQVDVMVACETQKRGPGRRRKRGGGKYPVLPKPVRLSRNGKKLGRPRTKNVQEHVEDFVRGATSIMEPLSICLPQFNHLLQCNNEDQSSDGNVQSLESTPQSDGAIRAFQETPEEAATQYAEPEDERRVGCRAPKSTFRCKEIAVRQHDNFTQIVLVSTTKQRNALSVQALSELESVLQSARKDASCHVVLLSAPTGNMFCSGVDLQGLVSSDGHPVGHRVAFQASEALKSFLKTLVSFPKPVVAAVNGEAVGLGATLLPLCDVVYASDKATFRTLYGRIGQAPEGGATCTMPDLLGPARASELLLTGRKLTATEAFEQGLVSQVLWPETFMEQVIPRVRHLASQSVQFAETTKALMRCHQRARVEMAIEMECRLLASQWQSKECQNNIRNLIQQNELS